MAGNGKPYLRRAFPRIAERLSYKRAAGHALMRQTSDGRPEGLERYAGAWITGNVAAEAVPYLIGHVRSRAYVPWLRLPSRTAPAPRPAARQLSSPCHRRRRAATAR
ncbi:hypothetical protein GCM10009548_31970 [Streptomyces malaysiensis subsp. malaysiensis]